MPIDLNFVGIALTEGWANVMALKDNINTLWAVMIALLFLARAKEINARAETRGEIEIAAREHKKVKQRIKEVVIGIEDNLWHGLGMFKDRLHGKNQTKIQIHFGNYDLVGVNITDVKRDYHQAMGKESPFLIDRILGWLEDDAYWNDKSQEAVTAEIHKTAEEERQLFLSNIHKRAGYCQEIVDMESEVFPLEKMVDRLTEIVRYAENCRTLRTIEERNLQKAHEISILNVLKIGKIVFFKRK